MQETEYLVGEASSTCVPRAIMHEVSGGGNSRFTDVSTEFVEDSKEGVLVAVNKGKLMWESVGNQVEPLTIVRCLHPHRWIFANDVVLKHHVVWMLLLIFRMIWLLLVEMMLLGMERKMWICRRRWLVVLARKQPCFLVENGGRMWRLYRQCDHADGELVGGRGFISLGLVGMTMPVGLGQNIEVNLSGGGHFIP